MNGRSLFLSLIVMGLFFFALIFRNGDLVWLAFMIIVYIGIGIFQSPVREEIALHLHRTAEKSKRDGAYLVEVTVKVRNEGKNTLCFSVADPFREEMKLTDGSLYLRAALRPGEETELKYAFQAARGGFTWNQARVTVSDPLDVTETEIILDAGANVFLQPPLRKFRPFPLRLRKTLSSPGSIPTRMGGSGTDFWMVRDYHSGDPLKLLDWRMTARHPHRFFTREFVQEKTAEITLVLDARTKMDFTAGEETLFEIEVKAAASLAEMFLRQGHRVGLLVIGQWPLRVFPDYGRIQLNRILNCLAGAETGTAGTSDSMESAPIGRISRKSIMVVLSPLDSSDIPFFRRLKSFGFEVLLICPDTLDFAGSTLYQDTATRLALRASRMEHVLNLNLVSQLSISVIDWRVREPLSPLIRHALGRPLRVNKM